MDTTSEFERAYVRPAGVPVLIVGSRIYPGRADRRALYSEAVGIDMLAGEGVDHALDLEEPPPKNLGPFAHVECMSVLEHSTRPWLLAQNIERLMRPGASLFVTVPFVWRVHGYPNDYWRFTPAGVRHLFPQITWERMAFMHVKLSDKLKTETLGGHPYFARTEVAAFGFKR